MKKSLTENLISIRWKKCALLKESYERDGIRTHAPRPYWISSPTPQQLGHPVCTIVEVRNILFSFLIFVDSNSNRPVDAHFWSEIDYCWVCLILIVYLEIDEKFLNRKIGK